MATRRKKTRRSAARGRKPGRKPAAKKRARKPAARKAAKPKRTGGSLAALARRFVEATHQPETFVVAELYAPDCVSIEATGSVHRGHAGIEEKLVQWEQMQNGVRWRARNVLLGDGVICIEWDAEVTLRDGRVVQMPEVAVHEIENGRIARERYYYNPLVLAPAAS
jgi:ketosteroid isomerase-like protein